MFKKIVFTEIGGYPLDQDTLDFLQSSYEAQFGQIGSMGIVGSTPAVVSGMAVSGGGNTVANGWFMYGGELIPFTGSTVTPGVGQVALVTISTATDTLEFEDGSTPGVIITKTAALTVGASSTTASQFPVSSLVSWAIGFGRNNRETAYHTLALSHATGSVTGTFKYKKNYLTNELHYQLNVATTNPSAFADAPTASPLLVGILDAEYCPATIGHFNGGHVFATLSSQPFMKLNVGGYINSVRITIGAGAGLINVYFVKPASGITVYQVYATGVMSLD